MYIDSSLPPLLHSLLAQRSLYNPSFAPLCTLSPFLYDLCPPPLHPYTQASSAYSAIVQLYACSAQLPTNLTIASRFHDRMPLCCFSCPSLEDPHHIFVHCLPFQHLRDKYSSLLLSDSRGILGDLTLTPSTLSHLDRVVTNLFRDHECWPLASSRFYLGLLPPLLPTSTPLHLLPVESRHLLTRLAHCCHTSAIRLSARIWGLLIWHSLPPSKLAACSYGARASLGLNLAPPPPIVHSLLDL